MGFAHRGLHGPGVPENSLAAFRAAIEAGAGIECDVRLSSDGRAMVFHDHDLRRLCASALTVEATAADALSRQRLFDTDQHIPSLRDMLHLAGGQVPVLIELKCRGGNASKLSAAVVAELKDYSGSVGVMSFEPAVGKWLLRNAPAVRRGLVISRKASAFDRWRCIRASSPDFLAIDCGAVAQAWATRQRHDKWIYSWTVRSVEELETAAIHADAPIWEGHGRPRI